MSDDETPEWVKAALGIEGVEALPTPDEAEPARCESCGQDDECRHTTYEMRANGSYRCAKCKRLLHGQPIKGDPTTCAQCGRVWK